MLNWALAAREEQKIDIHNPLAHQLLGARFYHHALGMLRQGYGPLVFLCIGTDRSTGDSLGPLVGSRLVEGSLPGILVYGTLEHPVHATNLQETLAKIQSTCTRPCITAIDACLGRLESVGNITIGKGSLKPGAGVNKILPAVGHIYITGVVNVGGFMEYFVLQNTRLNLVIKMARVIADGLTLAIPSLVNSRIKGVL